MTIVRVQVIGQMQEKLRLHCAPVQLPIGLEDQHAGLIDLIKMKAFQFKGPNGEDITEVPLLSCSSSYIPLISPSPSPLAHSSTYSNILCQKKVCPGIAWEALSRLPG